MTAQLNILKATEMYILDGWIVCGISIHQNNMDESQMHHGKWKKPDSKGCMPCYSIYDILE